MDNQLNENTKTATSMNEMQQQAVLHSEGALLILAGAGSGKTTVLVSRIAHILESGLCAPWQILAITFTNKAANELKERICRAVSDGGNEIWAATFHSTCARILRRYGDRIGYSSHFTIYDTDDQKRVVKEIMKGLNIDDKYLPVRSVLSEISSAKDLCLSPEQLESMVQYDNRKLDIARIYLAYRDRLISSNAMDFDDLLLNTVLLFEKNPDVLEYYQRQFHYIMVDEYQDTNRVQYRFVSMLAAMHQNICVVGDDDQSIYKFRGATIENILSFETSFRNATVIRLEQNYRSTKTILNAANDVISNNTQRKGKTLWTENDAGEKVVLHTARDEREEGKYIADTILELVATGMSFSDFAILYRMNAQSNSIEYALSRSGIPHRIIGGHRFFDREEVRDMLAYLQVINNPGDDLRLGRIINKPKRAIGDTSLQKAQDIANGLGESLYEIIGRASDFPELSRCAAKLLSFHELIAGFIDASQSGDYSLAELYNLILEHTEYKAYLMGEKDRGEERVENVEELLTSIITFELDYDDEATLSAYLEEVSLQTDIDNYDQSAECVTMMTLHSSKGLEFPVVFIPGMEEGIFPSGMSMFNPDELSEEHRLAYVGITRAKKRLYLVRAQSRMLFGSTQHNMLSRFAREISDDYIEHTGAVKAAAVTDAAAMHRREQMKFNPFAAKSSPPAQQGQSASQYAVGDKVLHKVFGKGMIVKAERMGGDTMLEVAFDSVGTKTLMANFCKMEKI